MAAGKNAVNFPSSGRYLFKPEFEKMAQVLAGLGNSFIGKPANYDSFATRTALLSHAVFWNSGYAAPQQPEKSRGIMKLLRAYPTDRRMSSLILITALWFFTAPIWAENESPAGLWRTVDDKSGAAKSLVRIWQQDGFFYGKIEKLLRPSKTGKPRVCDKCDGELKNAPVLGLRILWDLKENGDEWSGGQILDPENGKIYRVKMSLQENGGQLEVRGYIGFSLFGRSQTWNRIE